MPLKYLRFVISYFLWSVNRARNPSPSPFTLQGGTTVINVLGREEPSHLPLESYIVRTDCKTVGFFTKSVKKSVKRAVRVLRARSARASHARRAYEARDFSVSPQVSLSVFSLVPDLLFDYSRVLEYAKIRTVLQSSSDTACPYEIHVRLKVHHRVKSFLKYWSPLLLTYNKVLLFDVYHVIPATDSTCMITARDLSRSCRHTTVVYKQFNASKAFVRLQLQVKSLRYIPFYLLRKET